MVAVLGMLDEIRKRAAARGMSLARLAVAADMQPGNLRRMLMSATASPRLGSVMRLLPPLQCQVDPAGAHTAGQLVAFLDIERQRQGRTWEQLLASTGLDTQKISLSLSRPERMTLDVFTGLAEALHIDIELVDDPGSVEEASASHPAAVAPDPACSTTSEADMRSAPHHDEELAAARTAVAVLEAEVARQAEACAKAEKQAALAGALLGDWIQVYTRKAEECQEALARLQTAEDGAAQAAIVAASHAERLRVIGDELDVRRKAQADDAAHLTALLEANRIPEAITFFASRVLGTRFEDADDAFDALEQRGLHTRAESVDIPSDRAGRDDPEACVPDADPVPDFDARPPPVAGQGLDAELQPRVEYRRRYVPLPDGLLRTTRAGVPDGESASRWEPKHRKGRRGPLS